MINEGLSTIGDIILERIDCFGNKGECGVVLFIVLIESNDYERSLKSLEFTPIASKMRRDILETVALMKKGILMSKKNGEYNLDQLAIYFYLEFKFYKIFCYLTIIRSCGGGREITQIHEHLIRF